MINSQTINRSSILVQATHKKGLFDIVTLDFIFSNEYNVLLENKIDTYKI